MSVHFDHQSDEFETLRRRAGADANARALKALKARNNWTNWRFLAGVWAIIATTIGVGLWLESDVAQGAVDAWWLAPFFLLSTAIIGASQHQLGGAVHEGVHSLLFEDRRLNELGSDWLAAFPIYTSTYQYRVQHLAHHQFVNDPDRDPDIAQLKDSDHWLDFPITHFELVKALAKQLWLPNLMRYTLMRAKYGSIGHKHNPYVSQEKTPDPLPIRVGVYFAVAAPLIGGAIMRWPGPGYALAFLVGSFIATIVYFIQLPEEKFPQTRLQPIISHRATTISRMTFLFIIYAGFTTYDWLHDGAFAGNHYMLYWVIPLFTAFPLFMMLRQWVQHGNADRGRYTNTRVFLCGPIFRYAVFPWGMDYHLPHHVVASVPHYRLKALHELLLDDPKYASQAVVVENVVGEDSARTGRPTIASVLSRAPRDLEAPYVDSTVLDQVAVKEAAEIAAEAKRSIAGAGSPDLGTGRPPSKV